MLYKPYIIHIVHVVFVLIIINMMPPPPEDDMVAPLSDVFKDGSCGALAPARV